MLIKHMGLIFGNILLNVAGGGQVVIKPNHEVNVDLLDPFDPFVVGLFAAEHLGGDLKAAQQGKSDNRSVEQRDRDAFAAARERSSELRQRHDRAAVSPSWSDEGRTVALDAHERNLAGREAALSDREAAVTKQADTAGNGLGWGPQS